MSWWRKGRKARKAKGDADPERFKEAVAGQTLLLRCWLQDHAGEEVNASEFSAAVAQSLVVAGKAAYERAPASVAAIIAAADQLAEGKATVQ